VLNFRVSRVGFTAANQSISAIICVYLHASVLLGLYHTPTGLVPGTHRGTVLARSP
jgi:hypothetical protein